MIKYRYSIYKIILHPTTNSTHFLTNQIWKGGGGGGTGGGAAKSKKQKWASPGVGAHLFERSCYLPTTAPAAQWRHSSPPEDGQSEGQTLPTP